jgi:CMP-N-acetylneuraminic acid synthetase
MNDNLLTAFISIPEEAGYFFPNRHFVSISGDFLYSVMIAKLQAMPQVGQIIVNSDSGRIKSEYNHREKVKVIDVYRAEPQQIELELTSDKVTAALLEHAEGEHFLQLGPIFPFLKHKTIDSVIETYDKYVLNPEDNRKNDSVFTMRTLNRRYYDSDTDFIREDRPNTFVEDGILHVFNRTTFLAEGKRKVGKTPFALGVDEIENLAIDSEENYILAIFVDEHRHRFPNVFGR